MELCIRRRSLFLKFLFFMLYSLITISGVNTANQRKCYHKRTKHQKYYYSGESRRVQSNSDIEAKFEKLRIHFDYTYTLKYEENILKELIIPPVKKLLESTLRVRRFPGKIRFPKNMQECESIPIPNNLKYEGVAADLLILLSTDRGVKKYKHDQNVSKMSKNSTQVKNLRDTKNKSTLIENLKNKIKKSNAESKEELVESYKFKQSGNVHKTNEIKNSTTINDKPHWETEPEVKGVIAWSYNCVQDIYTLRPIAGVMNYVANLELTPKSVEETIWTTLHEISHILVMDYDLFPDFINNQFNRLGYEKTIKIKTRLKYLDKILADRHHLMNDYLAFGRFERYQNKSQIEQGKFGVTNQSVVSRFESDSDNNIHLSNYNNNKNDDHSLRYDSNEYKFTTGTENKRINKNFKTNQEKASNNIQDSVKKIYNSNSTANISILNTTRTKDERKNISSAKVNLSIDVIYNTGTYDEPIIKLPELSEYYELKIYPELNITTLTLYIENFMENTRIFLATPKVIEMARTHYNCDKVEGIELEHQGNYGSAYSHWSKRILNTDYLVADIYGEFHVSNISLALFEDSGWYKVDYTKSDKLLWGRNKGCSFLTEKCVVKKVANNPFILTKEADSKNTGSSLNIKPTVMFDTNFKDEFCVSMDEEICSISNVFRAKCSLKFHEDVSVPHQYNYFGNSKMFAESNFGDYCPYPIEWMDDNSNSLGSCRNGKLTRKDLGEMVCDNCRCFRSSLVEDKLFNSKSLNQTKQNNYTDIRAACYKTRCRENNDGKIELAVYVNDIEIICPRGGGLLSVDGYSGFIKCPKAEIICSGIIDTKTTNLSNTSSYILTSQISNNLLQFFKDYFEISLYKK